MVHIHWDLIFCDAPTINRSLFVMGWKDIGLFVYQVWRKTAPLDIGYSQFKKSWSEKEKLVGKYDKSFWRHDMKRYWKCLRDKTELWVQKWHSSTVLDVLERVGVRILMFAWETDCSLQTRSIWFVYFNGLNVARWSKSFMKWDKC